MKYSEFREYLTFYNISLNEDEESLTAAYKFEISKTEEHSIRFLINFFDFPYEFDLIKKVIELAETPLSEREEEKKYYLKHRFINDYTTQKYFNFTASGGAILSNRLEGEGYKTKFTKAEIEEFKKRFDTDLRDFELIEVEG